MRRIAILTCALMSLTACATTVAQIPASQTAGPGAEVMSAFDAGVIFADTCLIRGANFEDALEGLRVHNVTQNAVTGTYYHNRANLSVRVTPEQCSMVYATSQDVDSAVQGLAGGSASILQRPAPEGISVTSQLAADGLRYFRLGIQSPVQ